tara:strand:+ start:28 stop:936 length:909 start_codon:yes stop_codon:yes gene_type:complete
VDKVSVILTTYNSESSIQKVLDSIFNQNGVYTSFDLELLIVDDCSTDSTRSILEENKLLYFSTKKNSGGPNKGRNIALKKSTGDFICIADHDDFWFPNKIIELLSVSHLAPIVSSGYLMKDSHSKREEIRVKKSLENHIIYENNETFLNKLIKSKFGQQTYLGSILFSSSLKHIFFEEEYGMIDFDWVLKLFHNNSSVELCKSLYVRNVEGRNLSLNEDYRINDYNYSLKIITEFSEKYPNEVRKSKKRINGSMGRYYYLMGNMKNARKYLFKSGLSIVSILYLITTFVGHKFVRKHFNIFG